MCKVTVFIADGTEETEGTEEAAATPIHGWITVDSEEIAAGTQVTLKANADADLTDAYIVWQTKAVDADDEAWEKIGYSDSMVLDVTEENINNEFRFKIADDTYSDTFRLVAAEAVEEEGTEEETAEVETAEETAEENSGVAEIEENAIIDETENELTEPEAQKLKFEIICSEGGAMFGDTVKFVATLDQCDITDYTLQWQSSEDDENWTDIEGANSETMDVVVTEDNYYLYWRVVAYGKAATEENEQDEISPEVTEAETAEAAIAE